MWVGANLHVAEFRQLAVGGPEKGDASRLAGDIEQAEFTVESENVGVCLDLENVFLLVGSEVEHDQFVVALAGDVGAVPRSVKWGRWPYQFSFLWFISIISSTM